MRATRARRRARGKWQRKWYYGTSQRAICRCRGIRPRPPDTVIFPPPPLPPPPPPSSAVHLSLAEARGVALAAQGLFDPPPPLATAGDETAAVRAAIDRLGVVQLD